MVYKARICLGNGTFEGLHLVSLFDEPGFGYETDSGAIVAKGRTMADASAMLLRQYEYLVDIDRKPYWQQAG